MGDLYLDMGLPDKAETYYRASLEVHEQIPPTPVRTFPLQGLGKVLHLRGELDQAMEYMTQAAEAGKNYRGSALAEADAAALFRDLGNYSAAAEFFAMAAEKLSKTMGEKSPHFIKVRLSQAELEVLQGKPAVAEKLYRQVLEGARAAGGVSPDGADAHLGLAQLARAAGQRQAAIGAADHARREMRRYTRKMLPALGESEQLEFLANREATSLRESMALALEFREDALVRETAAGWVVNSKGLVQEAIAERTLLARGAGDEKVAAVLREWLAIRYRMARLSVAGSGSTGRDQEAELAALSAREQRLASQLGRTSTAEQPEPWVEIAAVRKAIPKDAVLIEIVRFTPPVKKAAAKAETPEGEHERKAEEKKEKKPAPPAPDNSRYLAWVIPPAGDREVQIVDLGRAVEMEETIAAARKLLVAAREEIAEAGEADAEAALKKELAKVTKLLLEPLLPHLGGSKHWILSPDGALWLVPWSALPMKDGTYLVETVVTQFVVSGRDLVEQRGQKASGNAPLVLADPDFDGKDGGAGTTGGTRGIDAEDPQTRGQRSSAVRSAVSTAWQRLPGTAREAKDLEPKLAAYTGSKIEVFTGPAAAEQVFRDAWQPRVAVLSTHGYFLEQPQGAEASPAMKSPLVRCGLVLAGANRRAQGAVSGDDGILTGLEIVGADLRGTELVVLSACETGLGEVRSAEGVVGLRQAFQLAGAQSVLASLWRVPDADTAHLMTSFYEQLAATGDKAGALRQAQLALLDRHRKESRSAHPYYWAAFTLTGRSDRPEVAPAQPRPVRPVVRPKVQVVSPTAPVMDGPQQVATARQGEAYEVAGEQGDWLLITVPGRAKPGWILKRHVRGE